ncbi:hypothetical protein BASA50_003101 [Batrachochytrium salamandrivorans]|uniref:Uncharacterized protein n=1 Tax=Batrachochytrium salamandrivorans TaxID=1357716 RepID=A0ABQ8FMJ2_9FUNG|nr:hypothetical protein BASA50_003101 [Batrachochytrium salamandrivorans]KAH9249985.1 hypothetical protein BASA81_012233 [Batrachochytrium salamandrivorans]KAJ1332183.1 hypothetical protein BSLG_008999 [Batrachochytrium salamandrivorans]
MKLISFAALSLLAITVSAYLPRNTNSQDLQESQGAAFQSTQEDLRQSLQAELDKLLQNYNEKQAEVGELQNTIVKMEEEKSEIELQLNDLSGLEKEASAQNLYNLDISLDEVKKTKRDIEYDMELIEEEYGNVAESIAGLDEMQE